jgi:subtilisin family serine protease
MLIGVKYDYVNSQYIDADVINGLSWIFHIADSLHVPCVVNMSIGLSYGPHDGSDLVDRAVDSLSTPGHIIVGAAGNDADQHAHISFALSGNTARNTWVIPVVDSLFNPPRAQAVSGVDIWGDTGKTISGQYYILDLRNNTYKTSSHTINTSVTRNYATDVVVWTDTALQTHDTLTFYTSVEKASSLNKKPHIEMYLVSTNPKLTLGLSLSYLNNASGTVHAWNTEKKPFVSYGISGYANGDSISTVNAIGGTSKSGICVGAYISKGKIPLWNGGFFNKLVPDSLLGSRCSFSSAGPTLDGRIKPDITAPGDMVVGAMSRMGANNGQIVIWPDSTKPYGRYTRGTGTSVSAPIVAGIIALMLEADPTLTVASVKQLLGATTIKDAHTGALVTPDNLWGAGKIDAFAVLAKQLGISALEPQAHLPHDQCVRNTLHMAVNGQRLILDKPSVVTGMLDILLYSCSGRLIMHVQTTGTSIRVPRTVAQGTYIVCAQQQGNILARQRITLW